MNASSRNGRFGAPPTKHFYYCMLVYNSLNVFSQNLNNFHWTV